MFTACFRGWRGRPQVLQLGPNDLDAVSLSGTDGWPAAAEFPPQWRAHGKIWAAPLVSDRHAAEGWVRPMGCVSVCLRGNGTRAMLSECLNLRVDKRGIFSLLLTFAAIAGDVVRRVAE